MKSLGVEPWGETLGSLQGESWCVESPLSHVSWIGEGTQPAKVELPTSGFELLTGLCQEQVKWPQKSESMERTWERVVGLPCLQSQSPMSYSQACTWLW